jgi:hypothetical protein
MNPLKMYFIKAQGEPEKSYRKHNRIHQGNKPYNNKNIKHIYFI